MTTSSILFARAASSSLTIETHANVCSASRCLSSPAPPKLTPGTCSVCLFLSGRHGCFEPLDNSDAHILPWRSFCKLAVSFLAFELARARRTLRFSAIYTCLLFCRVVAEAFLSNAVWRYASLASLYLVVLKPDACKL